jgi:hypothetical protein
VEAMSNKDLKCEPHAIRGIKTAWWYEEDMGLCIVVEPAQVTQQITIPWASLRGALKRKDKP